MKNNKAKKIVAGTLGLTSLLILNSCGKKDYNKRYYEVAPQTSTVNYFDSDEATLNDEIITEINDDLTSCEVPEECFVDEETTDYNEKIMYEDDTTTTKKYDEFDNFIECSDSEFEISEELLSKINKTINNFGSDKLSFDIYDIETQNSFSYNLDSTYNGACIVKPSVVMYLCSLADSGLIDLNEEISYEGNVVSGSGYLNGYYNGYQASYGQKFTILELMYHTLYYSDNNAYRLLYHYLKNSSYYDGYSSYMDNIDATSLKVSKDSMWVRNAKARDGVNVMKDLYDMKDEFINLFNVDQVFVDGNSLSKISGRNEIPFGEIPYYMMANAKYDYIENTTGNYSITKTGFVSGNGSLSCRNLVSISYGKRTYLICLLTKGNSEDLRKSTVNKILPLLNDVVNEYDDYIKNNVLVKSMD